MQTPTNNAACVTQRLHIWVNAFVLKTCKFTYKPETQWRMYMQIHRNTQNTRTGLSIWVIVINSRKHLWSHIHSWKFLIKIYPKVSCTVTNMTTQYIILYILYFQSVKLLLLHFNACVQSLYTYSICTNMFFSSRKEALLTLWIKISQHKYLVLAL